MKTKWLWLGLMALLLLWPATAIFANEPGLVFDNGRIFFDEDVSLEPGEIFQGDLGIFNGDLELAEGSTVNGDVFVTNGDVRLAGQVNGDLAVLGGDLDLTESGQVKGDLFAMSGEHTVAGHVRGDVSVLFGEVELRSTAVVDGDLLVAPGTLERDAGARVRGEEVHDLTIPPIPFIPERVEVPKVERLEPPGRPTAPPRPVVPDRPEFPIRPRVTPLQSFGQFMGRAFTALFLSSLFIAIGALIALIWPRPTRKVSECISAAPLQSFGLGLLTFFIAAGLEVLAVVLMVVVILIAAVMIGTVILIPVGLLLILLSPLLLLPVPLALVGGVVLGWVGLAELIGQKVLKALNARDVKPLGAVLVGLLMTVPLAAILWIAEPLCCAWPFVILLTSLGLGAVFHTRFGTQGCQSSKSSAGPEALPMEAMDEEAGRPDGPVSGTP